VVDKILPYYQMVSMEVSKITILKRVLSIRCGMEGWTP